MTKTKLLFILGIVLSVIIRLFFILNGSEVADIHSLQEMGEITLQGINPYLALNYNSYPPLAIYIEELTILVSRATNIPFYILIKVWPNVADILITLVIYLYLSKKQLKKTVVYFWSLVFFLNPISIIISSAHGQLDSITTFFTLLAIGCLTAKKPTGYLLLSPLLLGLGIAIKPNPLMLVPFFLLYVYKKYDLSWGIIFLIIIIAPIAILIFPFAIGNFLYVMGKLSNYSGAHDFGIPAVIRGVDYLTVGKSDLLLNESWVKISKGIFFLGWLFIIFLYRNSHKLLESCFVLYLWFITCYFGISAQYLSWVLPFAILMKDTRIVTFSIIGFAAIVSFYLFLNPKIIIVQLSEMVPFQGSFLLLYAFFNLLLWFVCLYWLIKIRGSNQ